MYTHCVYEIYIRIMFKLVLNHIKSRLELYKIELNFNKAILYEKLNIILSYFINIFKNLYNYSLMIRTLEPS